MDYSKPSGCTGVLMIYLILVIFHCIRFMDCLKALFKRLFIQKCTMKTSYIRFMHLVFVFIKLKALKKKKKKNKKKDHLMHSLIITPIKPHQKDRSCVQEGLGLTWRIPLDAWSLFKAVTNRVSLHMWTLTPAFTSWAPQRCVFVYVCVCGILLFGKVRKGVPADVCSNSLSLALPPMKPTAWSSLWAFLKGKFYYSAFSEAVDVIDTSVIFHLTFSQVSLETKTI